MTKAIEIFLLGLMVLVPLPDSQGMQVLLVKSDDHPHIPFLAFFDPDGDKCKSSAVTDCTPVRKDLCICLLEDVDISFDPLTDIAARNLLPQPEREIPAGEFSGQQPEWLVRMANIDEVPKVTVKEDVSAYVSVQTSFGWSRVQNCLFDAKRGRVHNFEFVDPMTRRRASRHRQALSEAVVFDSQITSDSEKFNLMLAPRHGGPTVYIPFDCSAGCSPLMIGNISLAPIPPAEQEFGGHFSLYKDLLEDAPGVPAKGLIPHRLPTGLGTAGEAEVRPGRCGFDPLFREFLDYLGPTNPAARRASLPPVFRSLRETINGPIICPMALADPR